MILAFSSLRIKVLFVTNCHVNIRNKAQPKKANHFHVLCSANVVEFVIFRFFVRDVYFTYGAVRGALKILGKLDVRTPCGY